MSRLLLYVSRLHIDKSIRDRMYIITNNVRYIEYEKNTNSMIIRYNNGDIEKLFDDRPNDKTIFGMYSQLKSKLSEDATIISIDDYKY